MKQILEYLLKDKSNRANGKGLDGKDFQFGVWEHNAGFKVLTIYRDNKPVKGCKGLIKWNAELLNWMQEIKAFI